MRTLRVALAQINCTVGDISGNVRKITQALDAAQEEKADLVAFPELAITGYPPEDLLLKPQFVQDNLKALRKVAAKCRQVAALIGFVDCKEDLYNAAAVLYDGEIRLIYHKCYLPNYGVFDENRYFQAGKTSPVFTLHGVVVGVSICEDIWYPEGPAYAQALGGGAEVIVNINASPFYAGKRRLRQEMLSTRAKDNKVIVASVNLVGGQDELVFDGGSLILHADGTLLAEARSFEEDLLVSDLPVEALLRMRLHDPRHRKKKLAQAFPEVEKILLSEAPSAIRRGKPSPRPIEALSPEEEVYRALTLGLADYAHKNGFMTGVVGLSGGIDSALTAVIAVDALGKNNVVGVFMPSRYTSPESGEDARSVAARLGIRLMTLPIEPAFESYLSTLSAEFGESPVEITEENLQARIRGNLLMALSNKFGWIVLTTGNKSEMSVGYATLYGDMAGGFAVIKDLWKGWVYRLAAMRNRRNEDRTPMIPDRVFHRPPTAELKLNQTDQDTLPPYDLLDPILQAYVEEDQSFEEMIATGFDPAVVVQVIALVDASEYKRRQSPVGIKISPRALGKDRRMPITNRYRSFYQAQNVLEQGQPSRLRDTTIKSSKEKR